MKTLYLECAMGAAGDMLTAALLELIDDRQGFLNMLNGIGIPTVSVSCVSEQRSGICGTRMIVSVNGEEEGHGAHHHQGNVHSSALDIKQIISGLEVSEKVRGDITAVYDIIAEAEGQVHGTRAELVHFHELGAMDALADIAAVCLLMEALSPERVCCSPIHVGSGFVTCAHGVLPVPAPATALILRGLPIYGGDVKGELCTPTGAALLRYFATEFGSMPPIITEKIGYGMGTKEFSQVNCVRAFWGSSEDSDEGIIELCCNLDDMTPEELGFAQEQLFAGGALDVYTIAAGMKKNRPGVVLSCMCREKDREELLHLLFMHTTTLGVREYNCRRYTLERSETTKETRFGPIRVKRASGWGVSREKAEFDDLAGIARERGCSLFSLKNNL